MELAQAKRTRRSLERIWCQSEKHEDLLKYRQQCVLTNQLIQQTRQNFYPVKVEQCGKDQKAVFKVAVDRISLDNIASSSKIFGAFQPVSIFDIEKIIP